jgi:hypothetical protein
MLLSEIRTLVRIYINDPAVERITEASLLAVINQSQAEIQKMIDEADEGYFSACKTYTVVASADAYEFTLPTDCKKIMSVERMTSAKPVPAVWVPFAMRHIEPTSDTGVTTSTTAPRVYIRGQKLGVIAPSDGYTLRMWYLKRVADLVAAGDISEIPVEFHNLIALHCAKLLMLAEERAFDKWQQEYQSELALLPMCIEIRQRQQPRYVQNVSMN